MSNGWKNAPSWANYRTYSSDGSVCYWEDKPILSPTNKHWLPVSGCCNFEVDRERELLHPYQIHNFPSGSLTVRPGFVESQPDTTGYKADSGKPQFALIPQQALLEVAKVMTYGAQKYAPDNWRKVDDAHNRYIDAALRHINSHLRGDRRDDESGLEHLAHAVCSLMMAMESKK